MRPAQAKELIGKRVEWEYAHCRHRGTCLVRGGILEKVQGRNAFVSGDWHWLPDMTNLRAVEQTTNIKP
jgi:hypothetical protein